MATFIVPTELRLTSSGVVNLDFLTSDNTFRLTANGIIGNGLGFSVTPPQPVVFNISWARNSNNLIGGL